MDAKDYEVGYRKPPRHTRFQKGVCPNPAGRRGAKGASEKDAFQKILSKRVPYTTRSGRKKATRLDILVQQHIGFALNGDVKSIVALLNMHAQFSSVSSDNVDIVSFGNSGLGPDWEEHWTKIPDR
jgi:hypothetical protein